MRHIVVVARAAWRAASSNYTDEMLSMITEYSAGTSEEATLVAAGIKGAVRKRAPSREQRRRGREVREFALSVVVPVFNEEAVLEEFHRRLTGVLRQACESWEVIYVDDGSKDRSVATINRLRASDEAVAIVSLSRNFGKEIAVTAGLDYVRGAAAVVIDADLQDPPEVITSLVEKWRDGYDMVYAKRRERRGETWLKRATAALFYRIICRIGETEIPANTGDFRLLNRRCLMALRRCRERRRFMKGLFAWVGFKHTSVVYDRDPRFAGESKWNYWRLWNLAIEGITSFTTAPLKIATYFGITTAVMALIYALFVICQTIMFGRQVPGYASLMVAVLFLSGVQLTALGIIGEYVGRIFVEAKGRPLYLVDSYLSARVFDHSIAAPKPAKRS
jgi:polyisoprenyl-phosphate glycosyltransferase